MSFVLEYHCFIRWWACRQQGKDIKLSFFNYIHWRWRAVEQVPKHVSKKEWEMAYFLCSKHLQVEVEHLLQSISVLEDAYFAYFVSPFCE